MWWLGVALAVQLDGDVIALPRQYRVAGEGWPGAVAVTAGASILEAPPPAGVAYTDEPDVVLDQAGEAEGWQTWGRDDPMNVGLWHAAGWRGQGVRVAVLDAGMYAGVIDPDRLGEVGTADCTAHPSCEIPIDVTYARSGAEAGSHGIACAHAVRSTAPDAELFLVRVNGFASFENAVDWAIRHDIDVLSMSMSFHNSSFYDGTGPFSPLIRRLVANDVLLVTSAGNSGDQHWSGPWRDADGDGRLDGDGDNGLDLFVGNAGGRKTLYLTWDEYLSCGDSDLDVTAFSPSGQIVGRAEAVQDAEGDRCSPLERVIVETEEAGTYRLEVRARRVAAAGLRLDLVALQGTLPGGTYAESVVDPGTHAGVLTVAAVRARGYLDNPPESFSAQGPVRSGEPKPELAGPDGLDSPVFGAENFFGTSASTPAVAGAVALVLSRDPTLTPHEATRQLQAWAWNPDRDGRSDPRWGAGKARLPAPPGEAFGCQRGGDAALFLLIPWRRRRAPRPRRPEVS